ncbi:MAG: DNA/RNA non-specific endonuclease [Myxococcales bacterium]|nr:DNA/RNA non-specific endonuclease [Myxococcales bacterium]
MSLLSRVLPLLAVGLAVLSGCSVSAGTDPDVSADSVTQLERDYGGADGLRDFFDENPTEVIQQALGSYGIGYVVHPYQTETDAQLISDCVKYFPSSDRNIWHNFNGEFYFIDTAGRPSRAYADLPPIVAQARISACQTSIGQWGDAEDPSNDYDGGHLIGSQLGGWGGRANIVPQDANFNRGNWAQLENAMALCGNLPAGGMRYSISVGYANTSALVPSTFGMVITNKATSSSVTMAFTNVDGGGTNGTATRGRGVTFLTSNGCR